MTEKKHQEFMKAFRLLIIIYSAMLVCQILYFAISSFIEEPDLTHDSIYGQLIQGDQPMLVSQHKVGDDAVPEIHMEYYNPVSETYYTVVYKE